MTLHFQPIALHTRPSLLSEKSREELRSGLSPFAEDSMSNLRLRSRDICQGSALCHTCVILPQRKSPPKVQRLPFPQLIPRHIHLHLIRTCLRLRIGALFMREPLRRQTIRRQRACTSRRPHLQHLSPCPSQHQIPLQVRSKSNGKITAELKFPRSLKRRKIDSPYILTRQ